MKLKGLARKDRKTKNLAKRLKPGEIAVINHRDIDEVAANSLVEAKIKLVINAELSISGRYPNKGPKVLLENNIPILDNLGLDTFNLLEEEDLLEIIDNKVYKNGEKIGQGDLLDEYSLEQKLKVARQNLSIELDNFIDNTIEYAKKEKGFILEEGNMPKSKVDMKGKHVLVVVRGQNYKEDLSAIISYIEEVKPVIIGVDGGADALLEFGYIPDIILGDMDSVTDESLRKCKDIIVHAYPDGRAPGLERVENLGLNANIIPSIGTSEDVAMMLAYENKADLIVALGSHSNIIDFLEKGRKGMASTFLVRMKIGSKLIDAKGVSLLYTSKLKLKYIGGLMMAALFPIFIVLLFSPAAQTFLDLIRIKLRLLMDF